MTTEEEIAHQRLSVLQLAEALRNRREAFRRRGVSRTQFYKQRRRFGARGLARLKDLPPTHRRHPLTTPPEAEEHIIDLNSDCGTFWWHLWYTLRGTYGAHRGSS